MNLLGDGVNSLKFKGLRAAKIDFERKVLWMTSFLGQTC